MAKVKTKYKVFTGDYYKPIAYKTKTIEIDLPKNEHGNILMITLGEKLNEHIKKNILKEGNFQILSYEII